MEPSLCTMDFKILIGGILKRCRTTATSDTFWKVVCWALAALLDGHFPYCDAEGEEYKRGTNEYARAGFHLAGGLFCVIFFVKCDQDWISNGLGLEHASSLMMCAWCLANCAEDDEEEPYRTWGYPVAPWNDISPGAVWRRWLDHQ